MFLAREQESRDAAQTPQDCPRDSGVGSKCLSTETAPGSEADPAPPLSVIILPGNGLPAQSGSKHPASVLRSCVHTLELTCRVYSSIAAPVIDTLEVLALALELTGNRPESLPLRNTGKAAVPLG